MMRFRFAAVGDNCIDRFCPPIGQSLVGGNALNVAVQLARLGHHSSYFGAVGDDADGARTQEALETNDVDVSHLRIREDIVTAYTEIDVLPTGERVFLYEDFGACAGYSPDSIDLEALLRMDHVHIGWLDDGGALRRRLVADGVSVSQDLSVNACSENLEVEGLTIAFGSTDGEDTADRMIADFLTRGAHCAVVTRGASGSIAAHAKARAATGIRPVSVIDTTGAGDSFIASFLAAWLQRLPLLNCLERGRDLAADTCLHVGGFPQRPQPL